MKKSCSVALCENKYYSNGYCEKHYQRNRKYGSPEDKKGDHVPIEKKFWERVNKNGKSVTQIESPCWIWTGVTINGYGNVWLDGKNVRAHRVAWIMENGPIADGLNVLHRCDTPQCVRVSHLFLGTQADNVMDRGLKGRTNTGDHKGEKSGRAKLTDKDIERIRMDKRTCKILAEEYKIDASSVSDIRRRKTWKHLT